MTGSSFSQSRTGSLPASPAVTFAHMARHAMQFNGCSHRLARAPGESDSLRRSMAAWKRKGGVHKFHDRMVSGMVANGYTGFTTPVFRFRWDAEVAGRTAKSGPGAALAFDDEGNGEGQKARPDPRGSSSTQHFGHLAEQRIPGHGFHQKVGRAGLQAFRDDVFLALAGHHDDGNTGQPGHGLDLPYKLQAAHVGHHDIYQDEVGPRRAHNSQRLDASGGEHQVIVPVRQHPAYDFVLEFVVIHDQYRGLHALRHGGEGANRFQMGCARLLEFVRPLRQRPYRFGHGIELPLDFAFLEVVEVRNANGLAREIARLKEGEVQRHLHAVAESVGPLTQWANQFQQTCAPHLESVRSLTAMAERVRPTVLIVDDDEFQHKIVSKMLGDEAYHLVFATGGVEALRIMRKRRPDLILMDFMMPDMDGLELMRQIKTVPRLANIPVIMITGKGEKDVITESLKVGAIDFMVKPVARDTLLGKVVKVLRGT